MELKPQEIIHESDVDESKQNSFQLRDGQVSEENLHRHTHRHTNKHTHTHTITHTQTNTKTDGQK